MKRYQFPFTLLALLLLALGHITFAQQLPQEDHSAAADVAAASDGAHEDPRRAAASPRAGRHTRRVAGMGRRAGSGAIAAGA